MTGTSIPSRIVEFSVKCGGLFRDEMMLHVGDFIYPTDPLIVKYSLFRKTLLATSAIWHPNWASVSAKGVMPSSPRAFPVSTFHIPWIAYLSSTLSTGLVVPPADVRAEHAPGGGLLLSATEEQFDPTKPEHLHGAHILLETMIARTGHKATDDNPL